MTKRRRREPSPIRGGAETRGAPAVGPTVARTLALGAVAYGLAVALSSGHPGPNTWGLDAPGYLPTPWRALTLGMTAIGVALLIAAAVRPSARGEPPPRADARRGGALRFWIPLIFVLSAAMWLLRVRSYLLGDQEVWLDNIRADKYPLYSEPLAALAWRGYVLLLRVLAIPPLEKWLAVFPVLCGLASTILMWRISRYMAHDRNTRAMAFVLIVTLGITQLYCGYFESYAVAALALLLYVLAGLRHARGEGPLALVGLSLAVAVATHLVLLLLIPSYILLVVRARTSLARRAALVLLPLSVVCGLAWLLGIREASIVRPFEVLRVALLGSGPGSLQPASLARRLADFVNPLLLAMPVPALLIASRIFAGSLRRWVASPERAFLMAAAIPATSVAAALAWPGSPAQDWDLMSVTLLPTALFGILIGPASDPVLPSRRLRFGLAMLALGPLLAFILVNADEGAATRRFKTIVDPSVALSPHERAYANEKIMKYYVSRQETDSALVYALRALAAESGNPRYDANVGSTLYNLHRYASAAPYFETALRGGLDRAEVHYQLGLCYMRERRFSEALPQFRAAADMEGKPEYLHNLGLAMLAVGDGNGAYAVLISVQERWPGYEPTARALEHYFGVGRQPAGP